MTGTGNVCILDYGSGNVRSVFNLFSGVARRVVVSNDPAEIERASHIVLPGVGAFGAAMRKIRGSLPLGLLAEVVLAGRRPFLGICVGMQVLATDGLEFGTHAGLGWIGGRVEKIRCGDLALPHVGWNNVQRRKECALLPDEGAPDPDFYFVHSYALQPDDPSVVMATTNYGDDFCSVVQQDNLFGVQFHPEKSQGSGLALVRGFLAAT